MSKPVSNETGFDNRHRYRPTLQEGRSRAELEIGAPTESRQEHHQAVLPRGLSSTSRTSSSHSAQPAISRIMNKNSPN